MIMPAKAIPVLSKKRGIRMVRFGIGLDGMGLCIVLERGEDWIRT